MKTRITTTESVRSATADSFCCRGREREEERQVSAKKERISNYQTKFSLRSPLSAPLSVPLRLAATCFKIRGGRSARGAGGEKGKGKVRKEGVVKIRAGRKKFP